MSVATTSQDRVDRRESLRTLTRWGLAAGLAALGAALLDRSGPTALACADQAACRGCRLHPLCFGDTPQDGDRQ